MRPSIHCGAAILLLTLACCKSSPSTAPGQIKIEIDTAIVRYDSADALAGPGLYYKTVHWQGVFNPLWGDSVVRMLLDSSLKLIEFWYPEEPGICLDPSIHEREIAKLDQPDSAIYRFGYQPLPSSGQLDGCIRYWRQYRIIRTRTN